MHSVSRLPQGSGRNRPAAPPLLSLIIPALDEEEHIGLLLEDIRSLAVPHEVIVADGGSRDRTIETAEQGGATIVHARRGRGAQLAAGARAARAALLCFLHADVRLSSESRRALEQLTRTPHSEAMVFRLRIDGEGVVYRLIELMANHVRTRLLRLPYGDQGLVVSRAAYDAVGGFRELPLMEDVEIVRALRRSCGLRVLKMTLLVSARRWREDGPWRRTFRNWALMTAYSLGASPERLARRYHRRPRERAATRS